MSKVGIIGNFSFGKEPIGGQTIRTRNIYKYLSENHKEMEVTFIDTEDWKKGKIKMLIKTLMLSIKCKNILILPAQNGVKVFIPLLVFLGNVFNAKIHYLVIGAWLADLLEGNSFLTKKMRKVDYIYVQTNTLMKKLNQLNISKNLYLMPNFKLIEPITDVNIQYKKPYKLCILSRINKEKGINDAIKVVSKINKKYNNIVELDIYGPVDTNYLNEFETLIKDNASSVSYEGIVEHSEVTNILKSYYLFLFPTKFYTEGFPGVIADAYFAGLPVLSARWESYSDIIEEGVTGVTYDFNNLDSFYDKIEMLVNNNELVSQMKKKCIKEASKYTPENALRHLIENLS